MLIISAIFLATSFILMGMTAFTDSPFRLIDLVDIFGIEKPEVYSSAIVYLNPLIRICIILSIISFVMWLKEKRKTNKSL